VYNWSIILNLPQTLDEAGKTFQGQHSSLLRRFVNCGLKKFYNIGPRWIKYEEDLLEGAERWGQPHISSLSFHSLINLRLILEQCKKSLAGIEALIIKTLSIKILRIKALSIKTLSINALGILTLTNLRLIMEQCKILISPLLAIRHSVYREPT